ncbi:TM2 domain-containing protein [Lacihabitans soyangensis]|uniref:TM2 domain-containing protein n=1 Tax=Lacihabitans soyangensis TaxID=869394 RepID=A0AAE3KXJ3_9BACT|nr:TM2 domain-containing protein [Lacihabitans soyangensis]MCP9765115.1 TM2 domain-containing protein [Lacihabitans soyangensis]
MKNRTTAGIFALLLGGLGIHKFYLGKVGVGIIYLIFCLTFIPAIVGFIEGIVYLTMSDANFDLKYNGILTQKNINVEAVPDNSKKYAANNERIKELYQKMEVEIKTEKELLSADYSAGKLTREEFQEKLKFWNEEEAKLKVEKKESGL